MIYATKFRHMAKVLLKEHKLTEYEAWAEFYEGLSEQTKDNVQRSINIYWTKPESLSIHKIDQMVIDNKDKRLERRRILHSHSSPALPALLLSKPGPASVIWDSYVPPRCLQEITVLLAPVQKSAQIDDLTSLMNRMRILMVEMDSRK